jgi:nucleoside-diphosphate-sugar epimerase
MRVFLTGGSGYIGTATLRVLVREGHDVTALARSERSADALAALGAVPVRGDLTDPAVLREAARAADGVIHLGVHPGPGTPDIDLSAALAMLDGLDGRGAYVHTGGLWVYGDTDGVVDEDAPQRPPRITAWRRANEQRVLAAAEQGGRPVLVMPGLVHGHGQGLVETFFTAPARAAGAVPQIGDGANHWAVVHVDDIAELYVLALGAESGAVYAGASEEQPTLAEIVASVGRAAGCPGSVERLTPAQAERRMGAIAEPFGFDQRISAARARRDLGWIPTRQDVLKDLAEN